jgi:hypothetical protein
MAITSTTGDAWAAEHTNLGTITLAGMGDTTRVAVIAHEGEPAGAESRDRGAREKLTGVLVAFARQIERKLASNSPAESLS